MRFNAFRDSFAILGIAVLAAIAVCLVPTDRYQNWQLLNGTIHARSQWIYERIHYDPAPIDVVFVGSSRIGAGIDAPRIQQGLRAQGLTNAHVVNFSLPEQGRNMNAVIVDELLTAKRPKLIVIGVQDKPSRFGHPAYKYLAPAGDVVRPGFAGNANYLSDLMYLPYRQLRLIAAGLFPAWLGLRKDFAPRAYPGSSLDTTRPIALADGTVVQKDTPAPLAELERGVRKLEGGSRPPILPAQYADVEFGDERHYIREIVAAARAKGIKVAFVGLPYYTGPVALQEQSFYGRYGPVWMAGFVGDDPKLYRDYAHLTGRGADIVSDWLVAPIAKLLAAQPER